MCKLEVSRWKGKSIAPPVDPVTILGDVHIFPEHTETLEHGHEFYMESNQSLPELVSLARKVAYRVTEPDRAQCISKCMDSTLSEAPWAGGTEAFNQ